MPLRIDSVAKQIKLVKDRTISPEAFRRYHAEAAQEAIADLERDQGQYPRITIVDGRRGASEEMVKAFGVISYQINPVGDVIDEVFAKLVERSPVGPAKGGHYRDDHHMYVNGRKRDAEAEGADIAIAPGDEIVFLNARPYARKIEGGLKRTLLDETGPRGGRRYKTERRPGLSAQAPDGVYEITAREMRTRFHNYPVEIGFEYRALSGAGFDTSKAGNKSAGRWPCIVIQVQ